MAKVENLTATLKKYFGFDTFKGDQELITTYNKHVAVLHLNENQMIVNDSVPVSYTHLTLPTKA